MFDGYKTVAFFVLAILIWLANYFGFAGWEMTPELKQIFEIVVMVGGLILRYVTKTPVFKKE